MKGKALRRALASIEATKRIHSNIPAISSSMEMIGPTEAQEMLKHNVNNRPLNWNQVEAYAIIMKKGEWKPSPQGIVFDKDGNLLTGQTRLTAIFMSDATVPMMVSRGCPPETAFILDRGRPQSARDLATRMTERKHSPTEASICRAICFLHGHLRPSTDEIAMVLAENGPTLELIMEGTKGSPKTKAALMILAAICDLGGPQIETRVLRLDTYIDRLTDRLRPHTPEQCWGKGTAFAMALEQAKQIIQGDKR
jgi:hypothetical protein